jgi:hypothetical protein
VVCPKKKASDNLGRLSRFQSPAISCAAFRLSSSVQAQAGAAEEQPDALEAAVACAARVDRLAQDSPDALAVDCLLGAQPGGSFPDDPVPDDCRAAIRPDDPSAPAAPRADCLAEVDLVEVDLAPDGHSPPADYSEPGDSQADSPARSPVGPLAAP